MAFNQDDSDQRDPGAGFFPETAWSKLLQETGDGSEAESAWRQLALDYWQPLYSFLRQRGVDHHSASDDIQGFFEHLLSRNFLRQIERGNGLFRSFLLASLQHWRTDQYRFARAQKRGGGSTPVPLHELEAQGNTPVAADSSPLEAFDRRWARAVYDNALVTLQRQMSSRGRGALFAELQGMLSGKTIGKYREISFSLKMSEGAVKQAVLEMRREFGRVLRGEIRRTVADDSLIDDEIRYLLELLTRE